MPVITSTSYGAITPPPAYTYATWDTGFKGSNITLSNGNKTATWSTGQTLTRSSIGKSSGKWYWELVVNNGSIYGGLRPLAYIGMCNGSESSSAAYPGNGSNSFGLYQFDGAIRYNSVESAYTGMTHYNIGDVIGMAFDATAGTTRFYKNNVLWATVYNSGGPISNLNANIGTSTRYCVIGCWNWVQITANFGATSLTYSPPAGYNAGLYT